MTPIPALGSCGLIPLDPDGGSVGRLGGPAQSRSGPVRKLLEESGLTPWVSRPLAPALQLHVRRGYDVDVRNTGTQDHPVWEIRPKVPVHPAAEVVPAGGDTSLGTSGRGVSRAPAQSGLVPLLPLVKVATGIVRRRERVRQTVAADPWADLSESGDTVGGLDLVDTDGYGESL